MCRSVKYLNDAAADLLEEVDNICRGAVLLQLLAGDMRTRPYAKSRILTAAALALIKV